MTEVEDVRRNKELQQLICFGGAACVLLVRSAAVFADDWLWPKAEPCLCEECTAPDGMFIPEVETRRLRVLETVSSKVVFLHLASR